MLIYCVENCEVETPIFNIITLVFNVSTDIFIMAIPLPVRLPSPMLTRCMSILSCMQILWSSKLEPRRKAVLLLLFGGGFFVIIAGTLRLSLIHI